jgi:hypothetical protein
MRPAQTHSPSMVPTLRRIVMVAMPAALTLDQSQRETSISTAFRPSSPAKLVSTTNSCTLRGISQLPWQKAHYSKFSSSLLSMSFLMSNIKTKVMISGGMGFGPGGAALRSTGFCQHQHVIRAAKREHSSVIFLTSMVLQGFPDMGIRDESKERYYRSFVPQSGCDTA